MEEKIKMALRAIKWCPYEEKKWDFMNLLDENTYQVVDTATIEEHLPDDVVNYIKKNDFTEHHLAVRKVDAKSSATMAVFNINRIDEDEDQYFIDQDQWYLAWHYGESAPSPSGALFSHGSWKGRTEPIPVPKPWIRNVLDGGLNQHIPVDSMPYKQSGSINELKGTSHWYAIDALQATLKEQTKQKRKEKNCK